MRPSRKRIRRIRLTGLAVRPYSNQLLPLDCPSEKPAKVNLPQHQTFGRFIELNSLCQPESTQERARSKVVKICLRGECKNIKLTSTNGEPVRCLIGVELDHNIPLTCHRYDIQILVPTEFASLLEVGLPLTLTLEQNGSTEP